MVSTCKHKYDLQVRQKDGGLTGVVNYWLITATDGNVVANVAGILEA